MHHIVLVLNEDSSNLDEKANKVITPFLDIVSYTKTRKKTNPDITLTVK